MTILRKVTYFIADTKGERWTPLRGEHTSLAVAREGTDTLNRTYPSLAPFKLYKRVVEVTEVTE